MSPLTIAERRGLVAKLDQAGLSDFAIADALDVSRRTVGRDLAAAGRTPRRQGRPRRRVDVTELEELEELLRTRWEEELDAKLEAFAGELETDAGRRAHTQHLLGLFRQRLEARLARGEQVHPGEVVAVQNAELFLDNLERFERLRELTREP